MPTDTRILVVCGTTLGGEADPEYANRAGAAAKNINITPIASGNVGTERLKVLEGGLPPGVTFTAVERFPSMAAIEEFWLSGGPGKFKVKSPILSVTGFPWVKTPANPKTREEYAYKMGQYVARLRSLLDDDSIGMIWNGGTGGDLADAGDWPRLGIPQGPL